MVSCGLSWPLLCHPVASSGLQQASDPSFLNKIRTGLRRPLLRGSRPPPPPGFRRSASLPFPFGTLLTACRRARLLGLLCYDSCCVALLSFPLLCVALLFYAFLWFASCCFALRGVALLPVALCSIPFVLRFALCFVLRSFSSWFALHIVLLCLPYCSSFDVALTCVALFCVSVAIRVRADNFRPATP